MWCWRHWGGGRACTGASVFMSKAPIGLSPCVLDTVAPKLHVVTQLPRQKKQMHPWPSGEGCVGSGTFLPHCGPSIRPLSCTLCACQQCIPLVPVPPWPHRGRRVSAQPYGTQGPSPTLGRELSPGQMQCPGQQSWVWPGVQIPASLWPPVEGGLPGAELRAGTVSCVTLDKLPNPCAPAPHLGGGTLTVLRGGAELGTGRRGLAPARLC